MNHNLQHFHGSKEPVRNSSYCHFHLKEEFIGVCPLCLNERLLTLASLKQKQYIKHSSRGHSFSLTAKVLSLGSLLNRLELRSQKTSSDFSYELDSKSSSSSQKEDSFISIQFEENGVAFWDKTITDISKDLSYQQRSKKHSIPRGGTLGWRKQIRQFFNGIKQRSANKNGKQESGNSFQS